MDALILMAAAALAQAGAAPAAPPQPVPNPAVRPDPSKQEVALPAQSGWNATLVYESDVGIWTCGTLDAFELFGAPDAFGLDDKGRCTLLSVYSGKWTPYQTVDDREWLGSIAHVDLDPRRPGREIYTGGKRGNLYQIAFHRDGTYDTSRIAAFPGEELHTAVAGDLDPSRPGNELLIFTHFGNVYEIRPKGPGVEFEAPRVATLSGRVRQAIVLPAAAGSAPWIAAACRTGEVLLLRLGKEGLEQREVLREEMGFGRLAARRALPGEPTVLYVTRDDGVILRLEQTGERWKREVIYAGPQGPRGVAAGRFDADPAVETVAVFGYSQRVELLSRRAGEPWRVETIFEDRDKGHWLTTVELDGRNGTDEIIGSGYGARMFLLTRPPGYGLPETLKNPKPENGERTTTGAPAPAPPAIRVGVRARDPAPETLSPLCYRGGFETKTLLYETLVRVDERGELAPGLAASWQVAADGRALTLTLRPDARFTDGTPVDAEAICLHLRRWLGLPEHAWLRNARHVVAALPESPQRVRLVLDEPAAVLVDLCAVNPAAIRAPSALDREGNCVQPVGSGDYRFDGATADARTLRYSATAEAVAAGAAPRLELMTFDGAEPGAPLDALLRGELDVVADGWSQLVPRARLGSLRACDDLVVTESIGTSVCFLSFRAGGTEAPDAALRRRVAHALDRVALIANVELGCADPCTTWAAPGLSSWPHGEGARAVEASTIVPATALRVLAHRDDARESSLAQHVAAQLVLAGVAARATPLDAKTYDAALAAGDFEIRVARTWGVPYDPWLSLFQRFLAPPARPNAASLEPPACDARLAALVLRASRQTDPAGLAPIAREIQELIDREAPVVPLYAPRRIAVARAHSARVELGADLYRFVIRPRS